MNIKDLYPNRPEKERKDIEDRFARYVLLALRIYERIRHDREAYARFKALTHPATSPTMNTEKVENTPSKTPCK